MRVTPFISSLHGRRTCHYTAQVKGALLSTMKMNLQKKIKLVEEGLVIPNAKKNQNWSFPRISHFTLPDQSPIQ